MKCECCGQEISFLQALKSYFKKKFPLQLNPFNTCEGCVDATEEV